MKLVFKFFAVLLLPVLVGTGCRSRSLHNSFQDYSAVYAQNMNEQLLLNLARKANGHPAYFMQMGPINSVFSFSTDLGAQGGALALPGAPLLKFNQIAGNLGGSLREQPSFSFTPLSGQDFANAILRPISPAVFQALFNQGAPANQLLRILVQAIHVHYPEQKVTYSLANDPHQENPENYVRFLRFVGMARQLQMHQKINISSSTNASTLSFSFARDADLLMNHFSNIKEFGDHYSFQFDYEKDLKNLSIEEVAKRMATTSQTNTANNPVVYFTLRTFYEVLHAVATEQRQFELLMAKHTDFLKRIPPSERQPILRIEWKGAEKRTATVARVSYLGKIYEVADPQIDLEHTQWEEATTWNRETFVLLTQLYHQIAFNPDKLPVQQMIQVN